MPFAVRTFVLWFNFWFTKLRQLFCCFHRHPLENSSPCEFAKIAMRTNLRALKSLFRMKYMWSCSIVVSIIASTSRDLICTAKHFIEIIQCKNKYAYSAQTPRAPNLHHVGGGGPPRRRRRRDSIRPIRLTVALGLKISTHLADHHWQGWLVSNEDPNTKQQS